MTRRARAAEWQEQRWWKLGSAVPVEEIARGGLLFAFERNGRVVKLGRGMEQSK